MNRLIHILRTYPLTLLCVAAVWYLSMYRITPPPFRVFSWFDKFVHCMMYCGISALVWLEYGRSHCKANARSVVLGAILAPIAMGGLVELAQAYLTTYRSGDWLDFLANSIGVVIAAAIAVPIYAKLHKW